MMNMMELRLQPRDRRTVVNIMFILFILSKHFLSFSDCDIIAHPPPQDSYD